MKSFKMLLRKCSFPLSILFFVFITGCSAGPMNPFQESAGVEINPVCDTLTWEYSVTSVNSVSYDRVDKILYNYTRNFENTNGVFVDELRKSAYDSLEYMRWQVYVYRYQDSYGFFSFSGNQDDKNPREFIKYPVYAGKKWEQNFEELFLYDYDHLEGEVIGKEDAGEYEDCWKIKITFTVSTDDTYPEYTIFSWYKEGIGLVKEHTIVNAAETILLLDRVYTSSTKAGL